MTKETKKKIMQDIEIKVQERLDKLDNLGDNERLTELRKLVDWVINGDDYQTSAGG